MRQIVPQKACFKCDICCRYPERTSSLAPCFLNSEIKRLKAEDNRLWSIDDKTDPKTPPMSYKNYYICPYFAPEKNRCSIYSLRPLDCRLYPFMVTYDADYKSACIVLDKKCPYMRDKLGMKEVKEYIEYLTGIFESESMVEDINANKNFINDFQEDSIVLKKLGKLSNRPCLSGYGLRRISPGDRFIFEEYFPKTNALLSCFEFAPIYIWSSVLNILWRKLHGALCVFAGNDRNYFMLLPPLDKAVNSAAVKESLEIVSFLNKGSLPEIKLENVPEEFLKGLSSLGLVPKMSSLEYLYAQKDLAELKGERYGVKRSSINNLVKKYKSVCRPMSKGDIFPCLDLYKKWAEQKLEGTGDDYPRLLIQDSYFAHKTALFNFKSLGFEGLVVEIDDEIKGYTMGYRLNKGIFVVLFETTDIEVKGLAQFIFKELAYFGDKVAQFREAF